MFYSVFSGASTRLRIMRPFDDEIADMEPPFNAVNGSPLYASSVPHSNDDSSLILASRISLTMTTYLLLRGRRLIFLNLMAFFRLQQHCLAFRA